MLRKTQEALFVPLSKFRALVYSVICQLQAFTLLMHNQGTEGLGPGDRISRPVCVGFAAQETVGSGL